MKAIHSSMTSPAILTHKAVNLLDVSSYHTVGGQADSLEFYSLEQPEISINSQDEMVCVRHDTSNVNK